MPRRLRKDKSFYVYMYFLPDMTPCYVGKGCGERWLVHERSCHTNRKLRSLIVSNGGALPKIKVAENLNEGEALAVERRLIAAIGRETSGGPLVNSTDGGQGVSGLVHSSDTKKAMALSKIGRSRPPEIGAKISAAKKGIVFSEEWRANLSISHLGRPAWNKGLPCSEDMKRRISATLMGKCGTKWTEDRRRKASESMKGRGLSREACSRGGSARKGVPLSEAHKAAIAAAHIGKSKPHKGVPRSAETRAKISATKRLAVQQASI